MRIHSLTTRFLLTLLLSTALPFLAFGWYARAEMEERLESQVVQVFLPDQARQAADEIEAQLDRIEQAVGTLRNEFQEPLRDGGGVAEWDFRQRVDHMPNFNPDLVLLIAPDGRVAAKTLAARDELVPASLRGTEWFERFETRSSGQVWESRHKSPFRHQTPQKESHDPKDYSFSLAYSIPTDTEAHWAVYALFSWHEVQRVLDETARFLREQAGFRSADVFLCDARGHFLAHSQRSKYVRGRLPLELAVELPGPDDSVELPLTDGGEDRRAGFAAVNTPDAALEWWVGLHARTDELLATSRDLSAVLLAVTAVTALVLVAWSMVASRAILRPVRRLAVATEAVARGDLTARVPARGRHELADLGRAFNRMAEDLVLQSEQLRQAERQAAWAEMARQIAHEIKNPLTPMRMSAQLLQRAKREGDPRTPEFTDRLARTVLDQTDALSRIASDFRQFAGPPTRVLEVVGADSLLRDAEQHFAAMAEASRVAVEFRPAAAGARVEVDREDARRVLLNLLHNAHQACGESGRIEVSSALEEGVVVIRVQDDGPGVDPEVEPKLFDPYFTTKSSGTGLGLAICRRILEAHHGTIALERSEPGRTVFRFQLPLV